jgi:predicted NAD/FAD-dependent oxidoreductase
MNKKIKIAVVGAGIAGLSAARELVRAGAHVTVFDKGRVPGGRVSTRFHDRFQFDHGAPYFTAADPRFRTVVEAALQEQAADQWYFDATKIGPGGPSTTSVAGSYLGIPSMASFPQFLARDISVVSSSRIVAAERSGGTWHLNADTAAGPAGYDVAIIAIPPAQATQLLQGAPQMAKIAANVKMRPCWTVLAAFEKAVPFEWHVARADAAGIDKMICNRSKPGRPEVAETWVIHATPGWSTSHLEESPEIVTGALLKAYETTIGATLPAVLFRAAHRWRYARPENPLREGFLWDERKRIGACGDWCRGDDVESAFISGLKLARAII